MRIAIVAGIVALVVGTVIPVWATFQLPNYDYGMNLNGDGVILSVDPGSAAAQAGIAPGDRLARPMPPLFGWISPPTWTVRIVHAGKVRTVALRGQPVYHSAADGIKLAEQSVSLLLLLGIRHRGSATRIMGSSSAAASSARHARSSTFRLPAAIGRCGFTMWIRERQRG